jgi:hypothetical protein
MGRHLLELLAWTVNILEHSWMENLHVHNFARLSSEQLKMLSEA